MLLFSQAPVPLIYHQQPAVVDPGWYYQQMMLYQMSPQNCIARPQFAGVQQFMHPGTIFPRYTVTTGILAMCITHYLWVWVTTIVKLPLSKVYVITSVHTYKKQVGNI